LINSWLDLPDRDSLHVDSYRGAYEMVEHLVVAHGHARIAMIAGSDSNIDARERQRGYRDALRAHGCQTGVELEMHGDFTEASGHAAALRLLQSGALPTAIFAANDSMAIGALSALRSRGVVVPRDMAVAGFDDIPINQYMTPALASVRVHISALGARACERLLHAVGQQNGHTPTSEVIKTEIVPRQSCGCIGVPQPLLSGDRTHE
jgi:LacI family transcriptional regulator